MTRAINREYGESEILDPQIDNTFTPEASHPSYALENTNDNPNSHLVWVELDGITILVDPFAAPHDVDEVPLPTDEAPLPTKSLPGSIESQMNRAQAYKPELKYGLGYIGVTGASAEGNTTASYARSMPDPRFLHHEPGYRI